MLIVCHFSKKPSALSKPHLEMTVKPSRRVSGYAYSVIELGVVMMNNWRSLTVLSVI